MDKQNKLEVRALLEAYRIKVEASRENNTDHSIRVCQAIIANVFGYSGRNEWTDDIVAAGLIDYNDREVAPHERYKTLTEIVSNIRI